MRKIGRITGIALVALLCGFWLLCTRSTFSLDKPSEIGRYQTAVVGSQTRLFAACFLLDSMTCRTWGTLISNGRAQEWKEVQEESGKAPPASTESGRYKIATTYVSDTIGQEMSATVRTDSLTGNVWLMVLAPLPWRWVLLRDHQAPLPEGKK